MEDIKTKHHVHVTKRVREYMIELLSTFIAVALAFVSQYYFQYRSDRSTEHDLMVSLVADLRTDIINMNALISNYPSLSKPAENLINIIRTDYSSLHAQTDIYQELRNVSAPSFQIDYSTGTINQLKNGGGLHLVHYTDVRALVILYDNAIHHMEMIQENVRMRKKELIDIEINTIYPDAMYEYDASTLKIKSNLIASIYAKHGSALLSNQYKDVVRLGNAAFAFSSYERGYLFWGQQQLALGEKLIALIQSHYKIP